jgi:hypothetical protein
MRECDNSKIHITATSYFLYRLINNAATFDEMNTAKTVLTG